MNEHYISGYCRGLDAPRMVELITEGGKLAEVDCGYESCPFRGSCCIAQSIDQILEET